MQPCKILQLFTLYLMASSIWAAVVPSDSVKLGTTPLSAPTNKLKPFVVTYGTFSLSDCTVGLCHNSPAAQCTNCIVTSRGGSCPAKYAPTIQVAFSEIRSKPYAEAGQSCIVKNIFSTLYSIVDLKNGQFKIGFSTLSVPLIDLTRAPTSSSDPMYCKDASGTNVPATNDVVLSYMIFCKPT
jgi:hypothetical protein